MRPTKVVSVASFWFIASLACRLSGGTTPASPEPPAATPAIASVAAEATPMAEAPPEPMPPAGLLEAIESRVEAGEWSYEEGLANGLELFAGQARSADHFPEQPAFLEGFGLVREVQRYVRQGDDAAARQQLAERLDLLFPTSERLLEYAAPAQTASSTSKLAAPASAPTDCADLFGSYSEQGFPPGSGIKCLLYKEGGVDGQTVRVYWPIVYFDDPTYADVAYAAILQAWKAYAKLAPAGGPPQMKGVDLLFMLLPDAKEPQALGMVPSQSTDDRCLIMMYLGAIQANEKAQASDSDYGYFSQLVAHEVFHCFQVWNFSALADDDWKVQDWWGEGTAEYFGNVVYPAVNAEWRWMQEWLGNSATDSILEESYANFGFFQYMGSRLGNNGLLSLINHMNPAVGGNLDDQGARLAAFPNIQTLFAEYARDYVDGKIVDTGGKLYPTVPPLIDPAYAIDISKSYKTPLDATPFTLIRYKLTFAQGHEYQIATKDLGGDGVRASRPVGSSGIWGDLPPSIKPACSPAEFYLVMTTTQAAAGQYKIDFEATQGEDLGCDKCLIGTWDLNIPSFTEYSEAPFAETPGLYSFDSAGGLWRYRFRADGTMRGEFDFFYTYSLHQDNSGFGADITTNGKIDIDGTGEGTYLSDGLSNLTFTLVKDNVTLTDEIYINGQKLDSGVFGSMSGGYGFATGNTTVYSCDDQAGELLINAAPQTNLPPIKYDRVSTDPNKP